MIGPRVFRITRFFVAALTLTLVAGACDNPFGPDDGDEIRDQRRIWESREIDDYSFEIVRRCFCPFIGWVRATVVDGTITELTIIDPDVADLQIPLDGYPTLTELFDLLEDAVEREASSISVDWDAEYGFPVDVYIDYEENTADEELGYEVRGFTPTS